MSNKHLKIFLTYITLFLILCSVGCSEGTVVAPYEQSLTIQIVEGTLSESNRSYNLYALTMPVDFEYVDYFEVWSAVDDTRRQVDFARMKGSTRVLTFSKTMYVSDGCYYWIALMCVNTDQGRIE